MLVYNITVKIESSIDREWREWIKTPVARVMGSGCFVDHRICRLLRQDESDGITYVIQFGLQSAADYDCYEKKWEPVFREEFSTAFSGQYVAFRTLMEVVG